MSLKGEVILETALPDIELVRRGKVRDVYRVEDRLLIVATDRISAFDVVLPTGIPGKGKLLNQISLYWFRATKDIQSNHVLSAEPAEYPEELSPWRAQLEKRSMLVRAAKVIPFECVVRGYLYGGGWSEYQRGGTVSKIELPTGLKEAERLPEPLFTPSTKAESGHDVPVSEREMSDQLGGELTRRLKEISLELYTFGAQLAEDNGIIIADTKFEFGIDGDELIVIDELLTPDSSRFWPKDEYAPGRRQPSFDKQFVRDYLEGLEWDKRPPAPELPDRVVAGTYQRYWEAFCKLTGKTSL